MWVYIKGVPCLPYRYSSAKGSASWAIMVALWRKESTAEANENRVWRRTLVNSTSVKCHPDVC